MIAPTYWRQMPREQYLPWTIGGPGRSSTTASSSALRCIGDRLMVTAILAVVTLMIVVFDGRESVARAEQRAGAGSPATQQPLKEDRLQTLTQELTEAKRKVEVFQAQSAESARSLEQEQQKSAALMQEIAAV